jgi:hypothetical protein
MLYGSTLSDELSGISGEYGTFLYTFEQNASCSNHRVATDGDAGTHERFGSDPGSRLHRDRPGNQLKMSIINVMHTSTKMSSL